jgi:hypothetical protein
MVPAQFLVCFARQVEVREDTVYVRRYDLARRTDVRFVELVITGDAEQRQTDADLVFEDLEQPHDTWSPSRGEAINIKPTDRDNVGAEDQRLDHVGATIDAAIDHDSGASPDGFNDLGQDIDRANTLIELAPAMVRHVNAVGPAFERHLGVLGGADALQHDRNVEVLLDPLDIAPVEAGLVDARLLIGRA